MFTAPAKLEVELRVKIGHYRNRSFIGPIMWVTEFSPLKYDGRSLLDTRLFGDYTTTREIQRSIIISILNLLIVKLSIIGKEGESRFHETISTQFGTL